MASPTGVDWEVRENGGEPALGGDDRLAGDGDTGLCWLGPALGLPMDADAVAELLADAEPLAVAEPLADGEGGGVDERVEADGRMIVGSGKGDADAVAETGSAWH